MRLPESDVAIIDRAAELQGRSRSEFMRDAAVRAAEEVLIAQSAIRLSPDAFEAFKAAIATPGEPVAPLAEALARKAPWDKP